MNDYMNNFVKNFLGHLGERNLSAITDLFADNVDWYIPGNEMIAPWLGRRSNNAEVHKFFAMLWKNSEPVSATIDHIFTDAEHAVITGDFSTRMLETGNIVDSLFCIQLTVSEGKIVRYRLLEDSYAVSESLQH
jgi:ketosteroid isomerase-like protein